ncbi:permease [Buchnera aphidicola (Diuraphis noxia)]|uniref:Permease n=1 Tax=Buchnera aphidicola subsp. Diuraphis noxia TaxID=118101 RepID=A0A1B2H8S1_BUCDN|nr:FtsX-like permease family protein [Buchnera aphidicola]ANZ22508.1 permease [Buchnera aphidicola (Diuraphis noxia)]
MYKPIYLFISLRYLWNIHLPIFKKLTIILSITSIAISIASLIIIMSIINGFEENFKKNILSFVPHLIVTNKNNYINKSEFPKNILNLYSFQKFSEFINHEVILKTKNNISIGEIIGVDNISDKNINQYNIKNISNILYPNKYNTIIGLELAKKLNIHIGDQIKLISFSNKKSFFLKNNVTVKTFKVIDFFYTKNEIDYYQILINKEDSLNLLNFSKDYITGWRVWFKNPLSLDINQIKKLINGFVLLDWKSQKGELFKEMIIEKYIMFFLFILILIVSIFNIFISLTIYTIEKKNSIAILQSQGLANWKIILIFVIIGSSTAVIGNIFGTIISIILIQEKYFLKSLISIFFGEIDFFVIISLYQVLFVNIASILVTSLATLYPALNSIKSNPAKILSNE